MKRQEFGQAGHFVGAAKCRFHLHTHARGYCVSTVGEWFTSSSFGNEGDGCAACGHARVFHQIGTGNGVPVGQPYCDDRHAPQPCRCREFITQMDVGADRYETMVFELGADGDHGGQPIVVKHWPTRALANDGHEQVVRDVERERMPGDPKVTLCESPVAIADDQQTYATWFCCALELGHLGGHKPGRAE